MMKIKIFLALIVFLMSIGVQATEKTLQDVFKEANEAYLARDFQKALSLYGDLEKKGFVSGDLFYNQGNAHYRMGQVGWAIYSYLKALRTHPRDRDLVANYRYVLSKRVDQIEPPLFSRVYHTLCFWIDLTTLKELLLVAAGFYWLFFLFLVMRVLKKRFVLTLALIVVGVLNLVILPTALAKFYVEKLGSTAVVISPVVAVYSEPTSQSIKLFELHEGAVTEAKQHTGSFVKVGLPDGKIGWVDQKDVREMP